MPRNPNGGAPTLTTEKSQTAPPATAPAIRAYRQKLAQALDALRADAPALALESAKGQFGAKDALQNLIWKMKTIEFELELSDRVVALAMAADDASAAAWRAEVQELPAEEIIAGIGKEKCCDRCLPGSYCAISGSVPHAAGTCSHPLTQRHLWQRSEDGVHYPYEADARSYENYLAACRKLKLKPS
jgi:hypothetical protein